MKSFIIGLAALSMFVPWSAAAEIPPIMYIDSPVAPGLPVWASSAAVEDDLSLISEIARTDGLEYYFSLPVEPQTGCSIFDEAWDAFGTVPTYPKAIVKVRIVEAESGFYLGRPGTMFRGEFESDLKGNLRLPRDDFLFFAATGEFAFKGRKICVRDSRFPKLRIGDEAVLYVRIDHPEQNHVSIGDGGVVGIRDGDVLQGGTLFRFLETPANLSELERKIQAIQKEERNE